MSRVLWGNIPHREFYDLMTISLLCALYGGNTAIDMNVSGKMKKESYANSLSC